MLKFNRSIKASLVAAVMVTGLSAHANLLQNGGFEDVNGAPLQGWGGYTYGTGYGAMAGWLVNSGTVDITTNSTQWSPAFELTHALDLNGDNTGSISQSFNTVSGAQYSLSFQYSKNVAGSPDPSTAEVKLYGTGFTTWTDTLSVTNAQAGTPNSMLWTGYAPHSFTGTGNPITLEFTSTVGGSGGVFLDAVAVVPEPEGYALALAGLGVLGGLRARRRKA